MYLSNNIVSTHSETNNPETKQNDFNHLGNHFGLANNMLMEDMIINEFYIRYNHTYGQLTNDENIEPEHIKLISRQNGKNNPGTVVHSREFVTHLCDFISVFNPNQHMQFALFEPLRINGVTCWYYSKAQVSAVNLQHRPEMFIVLSIRLDLIENIEKVTQQLHQREVFHRTRSARYASLTPREREILNLLAKGYNNPKIAEHLFISRLTVEQHRKNINRKIGTNSFHEILQYSEVFDFD